MKIGSVFGFLKHLIDICIFPNKLIELDGLGTINWFLVPDDQFLYGSPRNKLSIPIHLVCMLL